MLDLDLIGSIAGLTAIAVNIVVIASLLPLRLAGKAGLAAAAGAWVGLASGIAGAGLLAFSPNQPVPILGLLFAFPLVTLLFVFIAFRRAREALLDLPLPVLIRLNVFRVLGVLFLGLYAVGRLGGPFPFSAGLGDILTGLLAFPVAAMAARDPVRNRSAIASWNLLGAVDLFAAVSLGLLSSNGAPFQLIFAGAGSEAMQHLPFSLVPTVLVPFYLMTHGLIAAKQARLARGARLAAA